MPHRRPNILLIMPDQMRGDCLSLAGHPAVLTPNIDEIGGQGTHFRRMYSTCPSCIPARRSMLTGLFPATGGMVGYREGLPITSPTLPDELRKYGYHTAIAGRYMHQWPPEESYGYETVVYASVYREDNYSRMLEEACPGAGGVRGHGVTFNGWTAKPWHLPEYLHPVNWTVTQARRMLGEHDVNRPLFLTTSFYAPHPPLIPPAFYLERYLRMDLPPTTVGDWASPPANDAVGHGVDAARTVLKGEALRSAQAGYFGSINHIDDQIYWLIRKFTTLSHEAKRPWVILFTSDHGEMLGDHHYFRKCEPYEGSAGVPLLIRGSNGLGFRPGITCDTPVCLEDIMPTLLELAGAPIPDDLDGKSLLPILRGEADRVRPWLHGEHAACYSADQAFHSITDGRLKYIWRPRSGAEQLFDLAVDPGECTDLADSKDRAPALKQFRERLIETLRNRPEGFTDGHQLIPGRKYKPVLPAEEEERTIVPPPPE